MRTLRSQALWALAALALGCSSAARAASFSVEPVRIDLTSKTPLTTLTVRNNGRQPTVVQLETSSWIQNEGRSTLTGTTEILATPPIFTIPPGGVQLIRVGLLRQADPARELSYRILLREVVPADPAASGLRVALAISIPVFVQPPVPAAPKLQWQIVPEADSQLKVRIANTGNAHVRLGTVEIWPATNKTSARAPHAAAPLARQDLGAYLLPGDSLTYSASLTPSPDSPSSVAIRARTDNGDIDAEVATDAAIPDSTAAPGRADSSAAAPRASMR